MSIIPRTEQETTITLVHSEKLALCWTCRPATEAKWRRLGWPVRVFGRAGGVPISWEAKVPLRLIRFGSLNVKLTVRQDANGSPENAPGGVLVPLGND